MEYLYGDHSTAITERCSFCSNKGWTSPVPMKRIPQPVPDPENPTHFKSVNDTPTTTENGQPRVPDDFQPHANIKKMFSDGMLTTEEEQFSEKFAVEPHLIKAYIAYLEDLKIQSGIRTRGHAEQKRKMMSKTFEENVWRDLVESGDLKKLLVSELNKYLKHYKLVSSGTKAEKIRRVSLHVLRGNHGQQEDANEFTDQETKECGTEDDSEEIDSSGNDESEEDIVFKDIFRTFSLIWQTMKRLKLDGIC